MVIVVMSYPALPWCAMTALVAKKRRAAKKLATFT
jgi:hypothetical protein